MSAETKELKLAALPIVQSLRSGLSFSVFLIVDQSEAKRVANEDEIPKPSASYPFSVQGVFTAEMYKEELPAGYHATKFEIRNSECCREIPYVRRRKIALELKKYVDWSNTSSANSHNCPFERMGKFIILES